MNVAPVSSPVLPCVLTSEYPSARPLPMMRDVAGLEGDSVVVHSGLIV